MKKSGHASHDKVVEQMRPTKPQVNDAIKSVYSKLHDLREKKKNLQAEEKELFNLLKGEHNIPLIVARYEFRMQCLDPEVRAQFELNHADLKEQIGYQMSLPLLDEPRKIENVDAKEFVKAL